MGVSQPLGKETKHKEQAITLVVWCVRLAMPGHASRANWHMQRGLKNGHTFNIGKPVGSNVSVRVRSCQEADGGGNA